MPLPWPLRGVTVCKGWGAGAQASEPRPILTAAAHATRALRPPPAQAVALLAALAAVSLRPASAVAGDSFLGDLASATNNQFNGGTYADTVGWCARRQGGALGPGVCAPVGPPATARSALQSQAVASLLLLLAAGCCRSPCACSATRRCAGASVHAQEHHRCTQPSSWSGRCDLGLPCQVYIPGNVSRL